MSYFEGTAGTLLNKKDYLYDDFGRLSTLSTTVGVSTTYSEDTTYDEFGRVFQQFDVTGDYRGIRRVYSDWGYLIQLKEARDGANGTVYQSIESLDAHGNVTHMVLGNGINVRAAYSAFNGRLERQWATDINDISTLHKE